MEFFTLMDKIGSMVHQSCLFSIKLKMEDCELGGKSLLLPVVNKKKVTCRRIN